MANAVRDQVAADFGSSITASLTLADAVLADRLTVGGAAGSPTVGPAAALGGVRVADHYLYDYYYRIWVEPAILQAQNPQIGVPIPFNIWNAYPQPATNTLTSITATGANGLVLDVTAPSDFDALEYREVNVTITDAADPSVVADYEFDFTLGTGFFFFRATTSDFVQMVPDPPVTERWEWLTDVLASHSNKEQRIALRDAPRRSCDYSFLLESEAERRRQYNRWYKSIRSRIVLPYYQYSADLDQATAIGGVRLYFDPARADLREGEFALVYDRLTEQGYLVKVETLYADGCDVDSPISFDAATTMIIAPAFTSSLRDGSGLTMLHVTGEIRVISEALDVREQFTRPGSAAVINTFETYPVLDVRPIAAGDTPESFTGNVEIVDGETGVRAVYSAWDHVEVGTVRNYTIRRLQNPVEMDWWRDFLDLAKGQQNAFLMPTWLDDLALAIDPDPSATTITIEGTDYASLYFPYETFKRVQIETNGGIEWRSITSATDNGDGTTTLGLSAPLGPDPEDAEVIKVSFLNLVRLASDRVTLQHDRVRTRITLATRTTDE